MQNMEVVLSGIGLGAGVLGAICAVAAPTPRAPARAERRAGPASGLILAVVLVVAPGLVALLRDPPFSPGQHLAVGYLISGAAALVTSLSCCRLLNPGSGYWPYPHMLALSMALIATSAPMLLFPGDPVDGLLGSALAFTVVAGVFRITCAGGRLSDLSRALEAGAVLAVTLSAACALAVYHYHDRGERGWWAFPLALAGFWLLGQAIFHFAAAAGLSTRRPALPMTIAAGFCAALAVSLGSVLGLRLNPAQSLGYLLLAGAATGALITWAGATAEREEQNWPLWLQVSGVAVLLTLFLLALGFRLLGGFGAALALMGTWAVAGCALGLGAFAASLPLQVLAMGSAFVLLRLYLAPGGAHSGYSDLSLHYSLLGAMLGVLLPAIYSSFALGAGAGRAVPLGLLGVLSPVFLLTLWGPDALLGLMLGLAARQGIAAGLTGLASASERWGPWQAPTGLLTLGMALLTVQFSRPLVFLYEMPRPYKAYFAGGLAVVVVLWIVVVGVHRFLRHRRAETLPLAPGEGSTR